MSGPNLENMDMDAEDSVADEILSMSTQDVQARTRLLDNEVGIDFGRNLHNFHCLQLCSDSYHEVRAGET